MWNHKFFVRLITAVSAFVIAFSFAGCEEMLFEVTEEDTASESEVSFASDIELNGPYEVDRVVDGDTMIVYIDGERTRVRLIGIDTPESVAPEEERNTQEGIIVSDYVKELMDDAGYEVWLEYDNEIYDQYDRTLAYVYIDYDGELVMLERILLEEGMAETVLYGTNDRYYDEFRELERNAG